MGLHEALVSEEAWEQAQAKKYEKVNRDKKEKSHLLSGILKCPVCGAGMYGNKTIKKRKDGSNYKDFCTMPMIQQQPDTDDNAESDDEFYDDVIAQSALNCMEEMLRMVGIGMIPDLQFLSIVIAENWRDIIFLKHAYLLGMQQVEKSIFMIF